MIDYEFLKAGEMGRRCRLFGLASYVQYITVYMSDTLDIKIEHGVCGLSLTGLRCLPFVQFSCKPGRIFRGEPPIFDGPEFVACMTATH